MKKSLKLIAYAIGDPNSKMSQYSVSIDKFRPKNRRKHTRRTKNTLKSLSKLEKDFIMSFTMNL